MKQLESDTRCKFHSGNLPDVLDRVAWNRLDFHVGTVLKIISEFRQVFCKFSDPILPKRQKYLKSRKNSGKHYDPIWVTRIEYKFSKTVNIEKSSFRKQIKFKIIFWEIRRIITSHFQSKNISRTNQIPWMLKWIQIRNFTWPNILQYHRNSLLISILSQC